MECNAFLVLYLQVPNLTNKVLLAFDGVDDFLARRQRLKQKNLQGGAMNDFSVFGLE